MEKIEVSYFRPANKPNYVVYKLFDIKVTASFISAKMLLKDFNEVMEQEKPEDPYIVIQEEDTLVFYLNLPVGCYRIILIENQDD